MSVLVHAVTAFLAAQDVVLAIVHTSCRPAVDARNAAESMLRTVLALAPADPLAEPARAYLDAQTNVRAAHAERGTLGPLAPEGMNAQLLRLERARDAALVTLRAAATPSHRPGAADPQAEPKIKALCDAVGYVLTRAQEDPDLGYLIGPRMRSFELLCDAQAIVQGRDPAEVRRERGRDLQPEHRRRRPRVVELAERVVELAERVVELEAELEQARRAGGAR